MPNQPRADNPPRTVRVDDELWQRTCLAGLNNDLTASAVVRAALADYLPKLES